MIRVLIIDDDAAVRGSLVAYLEDDGFLVRGVGSAAEAFAACDATPPDVAVVDVQLPEMDGLTLIERVHEAHPGIRFIIYTGSVAYRLPERLARIGVTEADVLHKPVMPLRLLTDAIRRLAAKESRNV